MATELRIRRGTAAQVAAYTGPLGELILNVDTGDIHVQDGATAGGLPVLGRASPAIPLGAVLSLVSGVAFPEGDRSAAPSVFVVPTGSNVVQIWNGGSFVSRAFPEIEIPLTAANYPANVNFDVYLFMDGATVQAGTVAWASAVSRGTGSNSAEVETYQGRVVNRYALTLRRGAQTFNAPSRRAILVGSFRTTSAGFTEDSRARRFVSNVQNLVMKSLLRNETASQWDYSDAAWVPANVGNGNNRVEYLHCLAGRSIEAEATSVVTSLNGTQVANVGIGVDGFAANAADIMAPAVLVGNTPHLARASYRGQPGVGYHQLIWIERGAGVAGQVQRWNGTTTNVRSGLTAQTLN